MKLHDTNQQPFENTAITRYEKEFVKWWRDHTLPGNVKVSSDYRLTDEELYSKFSVTSDEHGLLINCGWRIIVEDHTISQLPFRFGEVNQMRLSCNKLATLQGAPKRCNMFVLENETEGANNVLDNILNGPEHAEHMSIQFARPVTSLASNFKGPIESLWIHAPSINSFAGLNVPCQELTLNLPLQKSITGIHKQLKNVDTLALVLDPGFEGGLLSLAMVKGLKSIVRSTNQAIGNAPPYEKAFAAINAGLKQGWNVHELQEKMIEAGLGKFARL